MHHSFNVLSLDMNQDMSQSSARFRFHWFQVTLGISQGTCRNSSCFFPSVVVAGNYTTRRFCEMNTCILRPFVDGSEYLFPFMFTMFPYCR